MIFLADTTCILALYMITQTMAHVLEQLVPLYSAGIVIYRRLCRVSSCFHQFSVVLRIRTYAHVLSLLAHPDLYIRYCQDLGVQLAPELVASQRKRMRRTPRGDVLTEEHVQTHPRALTALTTQPAETSDSHASFRRASRTRLAQPEPRRHTARASCRGAARPS